MNEKVLVQDKAQFIKSYNYIFISTSVFNSPLLSRIIDDLVSIRGSETDRCYILNNSIQTIVANDNLKKQALLKIWKFSRVVNAGYEVTTRKLAEKKLTLLLLTVDDNEGYRYEQLDYEDNHLNDIDSCTLDASLNCYRYRYDPPKEDFIFKFKLKTNVDFLKVIFHKTTGIQPKILFPESDPQTNATRYKETPSFVYKIDKSILFESDKLQLVGSLNGQRIESDLIDFFFDKEQKWVITVTGNKFHCDFFEGNVSQAAPQIEEPQSAQPQTSTSEYWCDRPVLPHEIYKYYGGKNVELPEDTIIVLDRDENGKQKYPSLGDVLYTSSGTTIKLTKFIAEGGEGAVYFTSQKGIVAKILNNKSGRIDPKTHEQTGFNLTKRKQEKIEMMVKAKLTNPHLCWPLDTLYTKNSQGRNVFVGYTMREVKGVTFKKLLSQIPKTKNTFFGVYNMSKTQLIEMIVTWLDTLTYLAMRNIVVGDLRLENVMIEDNDPKKVIIVDCDSVQIDKFNATKFTPEYVAPESTASAEKVYRTFAQDNYGIFVILNMLLLQKGGAAYTRAECDLKEIEKARKGLYPLYLDEKTTERYALGYAPINWSHLPGYIREAFYNMGNINGKYFAPESRLNAKDWLKIFRCYLGQLKSGKLKSLDKDYNVSCFDCTIDKPISYSVLKDVKMSSIAKASVSEFSFVRAIQRILKISRLESVLNPQTVAKEVAARGGYKHENTLGMKVVKDIGVLVKLDYQYKED